ncbi:MAG: sugar O-acetyltransferase [Lachnospiraceae bacterium]|nr:sugar O-acetyltransferase [Lachnospiraceae bacterium]
MTEKEKMISGKLYNSMDEELIKDRLNAKSLYYEYNNLHPVKEEEQQVILKKLIGKMGKNVAFVAPFYCDYGYNIEIGNDFFANRCLDILDCGKVIIGNNVMIGPECSFYTATHPVDAETRNKNLEMTEPVRIGNNVWIGGGVKVLPGVTIGDNVVIGAGSVVVKDIESNSVAVGNPCKVIKKI